MEYTLLFSAGAVASFSMASALGALRLARRSERKIEARLGQALLELDSLWPDGVASDDSREKLRRRYRAVVEELACDSLHAGWISRWQSVSAPPAVAAIIALVGIGTAGLVSPVSIDRSVRASVVGAFNPHSAAEPTSNVGTEDTDVARLERYAARLGDRGARREPAPMTPIRLDAEGGESQLPDVETMIARLAGRLENESADVQGWRTLGWALASTGRLDEAEKAYARAFELTPEDSEIGAAYGEAIVKAAGDSVTDRARQIFEAVLARDPANARARYFKGLGQLQQGDPSGALETWTALRKDAPTDADWIGELDMRIADVRLAARAGPTRSAPASDGGAESPGGG